MNTFDIIGVQIDLGATRKGVDMGPLAIRHAGLTQRVSELGFSIVDHGDILAKRTDLDVNSKMHFQNEIHDTNFRLFQNVLNIYRKCGFPITLGGDHSIAAGTVSAAAEYYKGEIGVIWVDAHGDYNDEDISPSGNLHGMPLSAVCGFGPESMVDYTQRRVNPEHVVIIGARALDLKEKEKLKKTGVTVFTISDVHRLGIQEITKQAISIVSNNTEGIYLSFDMDALDPNEAPGVGTPVLNGLNSREAFILAEMLFRTKSMIGIDVVETNPLLDIRNKTGILASEIILTAIGCPVC